MKIEMLGMGCKKCQQLEANAREAGASRNLTAEVEHQSKYQRLFSVFLAVSGLVLIGKSL